MRSIIYFVLISMSLAGCNPNHGCTSPLGDSGVNDAAQDARVLNCEDAYAVYFENMHRLGCDWDYPFCSPRFDLEACIRSFNAAQTCPQLDGAASRCSL